jgi:hypothetical protein
LVVPVSVPVVALAKVAEAVRQKADTSEQERFRQEQRPDSNPPASDISFRDRSVSSRIGPLGNVDDTAH